MSPYPNVTVKLILRAQGKIFMLRHRADGAYDFPGGRMEWGEAPEETLRRELQEELSFVLPKPPQLFGIWNYVAPDKSRHSLQLHYFLSLSRRPIFDITEAADPLWLDKSFFLKRWQGDEARVERMFARNPSIN